MEKEDLEEICLELIDHYICHSLVMNEEEMFDCIYDLILMPFEDEENDDLEIDEIEEENIENAMYNAYEFYKIYYHHHYPNGNVNKEEKTIAQRIDELQNKPQPAQRSQEWKNYRYNLITASNAYKALGTIASINSLICEKCIEDDKPRQTNFNSSMHWGEKYEPISVEIYEKMYHTKIGDFGCIQHETYPFIGASPDGINICSESPLYGRMLEIKNVVSRTITGIPKKEYWIQMQLQMEVCDLNECDFLETKFVEYESERDYLADQTPGILKGYYMLFMTADMTPKYVYKPIDLVDHLEEWDEQQINHYESLHMQWISRYYWKLEVLSCVLVHRNRDWFAANIEQLSNVWNIILQERVNGEYIKRLPIKKNDLLDVKQINNII